MHGLRVVSFMAHRYRHESGLIQRALDEADSLIDERPRFLEESIVRRKSMVVGDQRDQLTVAFVCDKPVDPFAIDTTGHEAIIALMRCIPADEFPHFPDMPHAQQ